MSSSRLQGKRKNYNEESDNEEGHEVDHEEEEFRTKPSAKKHNRNKINEDSDEENEIPTNLQTSNNNEDNNDNAQKGYSYEAGHILRIYCQDFMNHRKFDIKLGHHINFITGKNGSGKSALVHALQLGLGSSANETGRGKKVDSFIREGSEGPAIIKITLLNTGPDAYKPNEYGNKITVMRKIFKKIASTYHLLNDADKEISTLKSDLHNMLRGFSIFVDTPCCILTQDIAKKLINDYTAKDKFEFFCKATGLQQLNKDIEESGNNLEDMDEELQNFKPKLKQTSAELKIWEGKLYRYQELGTLEQQIKECEAKTYWFDLNNFSDENVVSVEEEVNEKTVQLNKAKANLDKEYHEDPELQQNLQQLQNDFARIQTEEDEVVVRLNLLKEGVTEAHVEVNNCTNAIKRYQDEKNHNTTRLQALSQELAELRQKSLHNAKEEEREILAQLETSEKEIERLRDQENQLNKDDKDESMRLVDYKSLLDGIQRKINGNESQMRTIRDNINNLSNSKSKVSLFGGRHMEAVVNRIKNTRFNKPVYGPLGVYVTIKEGFQHWNKAISKAIGGSLNSFIVSNQDDRSTLVDILKSFDGHLAKYTTIIYQPPHSKYAIRSLPNLNGMLVADALIVNGDDVFNALVDQSNIDRIALVNDETMVHSEYTETQNGLAYMKYDLSSAVTLEGTQVTFRQGNPAYDILRAYQNKDLGKDVASSIAEKQQQLKQFELAIHDNHQEKAQYSELVKQGNMSIQQIERYRKQNNTELTKSYQKKKILQQKLAEIAESNAIDTTDKEQELTDLELANDTLKDEINKRNFSLTAAKAELKTKTIEKKDIENQRNDYTRQLEEISETTKQIIAKQQSFHKEKENLKRKFDSLQKEHEDLMKQYEKIKKKQEDLLKHAENKSRELLQDWNGEPLKLITTGRQKETRVSLFKKIKELAFNLEEGKKESNLLGYTESILKEKFDFYKDKFTNDKNLYNDLKHKKESLEKSVGNMFKKFIISLKYGVELTQNNFDKYIQKQNGSGTVYFDTNKKEMSFEVQMDNSDALTKTSEIKNLSGGERSFVTLCWLLGLGYAIDSPFRLMDEYDVFMDEARRNSTLEFLIEYSKTFEMRPRQFIISTPNNLKAVKTGSGEWVKIHKMPDPIRNTAHSLQQQTID